MLAGADVSPVNPFWKLANTRVRGLGGHIVRTEPELGQYLFSRGDARGCAVGRVSWVDAPELVVTTSRLALAVAMTATHFVAMYEFGIEVISADGADRREYEAPDDTHLAAVETLPAAGNAPPFLVVLAARRDGRGTRILGLDLP